MDKERQKHFKELLLDEKKEKLENMTDPKLGLNASIKDVTSELSSYDNHPGDLGTETFEAEKNYSFKMNDKFFIGEIDNALEKIEKGNYGNCEGCHKDIDEERLELLPYARLCADCECDTELVPKGEENGRPIEEQVMYPPFGRSFTDHSIDDKVEFDGEDTWQDVDTYNARDSAYPDDQDESGEQTDSYGYVQDVEQISNQQYKKQLQ